MNDINTLMERKALIDAKDPGDVTSSDIDTLVAFFRHRRSDKTAFQRTATETNSLDAIVSTPKPAATVSPDFIRRFRRVS